MPIYEYECKSCGHELEALQKFSDELLKICPECDKYSLNKKLSAAGFQLKGSGWYQTDFKPGGGCGDISSEVCEPSAAADHSCDGPCSH